MTLQMVFRDLQRLGMKLGHGSLESRLAVDFFPFLLSQSNRIDSVSGGGVGGFPVHLP